MVRSFHLSCSSKSPLLLICDGHASHVTIALFEKARENGVHVLVLPSHTTHLLQPLDVAVFKSLIKVCFRVECQKVMRANRPLRAITKYEICSILGKAWPKSVTSANFVSGFAAAGIQPLHSQSHREAATSFSKSHWGRHQGRSQ